MVNLTGVRSLVLTFILALGIGLLLMGVQNRIVNFEDAMAVGKPSQTGFEEVQKGVFLAVQAQDGFHLLSTPIALAPDAYYRVQYDVRRLPREKVIFTADFYAPGYDNPEQELTRIIGMNVLGQHQNVIRDPLASRVSPGPPEK